MILLYYLKVNDFKYLHGGVTVYAKSLIIKDYSFYTVYTMTYSIYFNHHQDAAVAAVRMRFTV